MRRLLIRLYPAAWRERYGEELEALMADAPGGWRADLDLLWGAMAMRLRVQRAWVTLMALLAVGAFGGMGVSYLFTPMWEARAVMQCTPARFRTDGNPTSRIDEFVEKAKSDVMSRTSLAEMMTDPRLDLYRNERRTMPLEDVVDIMRESVRVTIASAPNRKPGAVVFVISFRYPDARKAVDTINAFIGKFENASLQTSGADTVYYAVLDRPALPKRPMFPKRASFVVTGAVAGLILAIATLFIRRRILPCGPGLQPA